MSVSITVDKRNYVEEITGGYCKLPNWFWEISKDELDPYSKVIFGYLVSQGPGWQSSRNNLARNLGYDEDTVSDRLRKLRYSNLINFDEFTTPWHFEIIPPSMWKINKLSFKNTPTDPIGHVKDTRPIPSVKTPTASATPNKQKDTIQADCKKYTTDNFQDEVFSLSKISNLDRWESTLLKDILKGDWDETTLTSKMKIKLNKIRRKAAGATLADQVSEPKPAAEEEEIDQGTLGRAYYKRLREGK